MSTMKKPERQSYYQRFSWFTLEKVAEEMFLRGEKPLIIAKPNGKCLIWNGQSKEFQKLKL